MRHRRRSDIWFTTFLLWFFFLIGLFAAGAIATAQEANLQENSPQQSDASNSVLESELPQLSGPNAAPSDRPAIAESDDGNSYQPNRTTSQSEDEFFVGQSLSEAQGPSLESPDSIQIIPAPTLEAPEELLPGGWEDFQSLEKPPLDAEAYPQQAAPAYVPPAPVPATPHLGVAGTMVRGWGFQIHQVLPNSPAARMQLEPGDVILNINGRRVDSVETIACALRQSQSQLKGRGLLQIDNVRARRQTCGYRGTSPQPARYIWLKFAL